MSAQPPAPIPPDDLRRPLRIARPETDQSLPHVGMVGDTYTVVLNGDDTNGSYTLMDMLISPGGGPPPHRHNFEESFTILEGEIEVTCRGEKSVVRAGETISIPANAPHFFVNATSKIVRLLSITTPAGLEDYFQQIGEPMPTRTTLPPPLDDAAKHEFQAKARALGPQYRTDYLKP